MVRSHIDSIAAVTGLRTACSDVIIRESSDVSPEAFTHLPLDLGAEQWAEKVMEVIEQGRISHEYVYNLVKNSHFSVDYSLKELCTVYGCDRSK